ncbi:hypothetical protein QGM71_16270 [Virgibacillus sp. C22-A2]|uniref:Uncharacterized protein n=1 Tax=Virgibacillus tibetensis TaxID=3042313 RepID=A0ABU6KKT6_9BACI|nr:hypothetical protein [Virgibacillus sp. C22-A2]
MRIGNQHSSYVVFYIIGDDKEQKVNDKRILSLYFSNTGFRVNLPKKMSEKAAKIIDTKNDA